MDWLELYSPMQAKWLSIPYKGETVLLQGLTPAVDTDIVIQLLTVDATENEPSMSHLPADIQALLAEFPTILTIPNSLPPKRDFDHTIPLIEGATPVNI